MAKIDIFRRSQLSVENPALHLQGINVTVPALSRAEHYAGTFRKARDSVNQAQWLGMVSSAPTPAGRAGPAFGRAVGT